MPVPVMTPAGLEPAFELSAYYPALIYAVVIIGMAAGIVASSHMPFLKPRRVTKVKQMPYESGMDPIGDARMQFDVKFYLIAILFLVFDVELLFLYPFAVAAYSEGADPAWKNAFGFVVFIEILIFLATLAIAYVYAWRKGVFQWR
ncbi:MAG: NADH-quinone oxidoreductase subunit A [Fimbriiglobus sp.]